jgi:hypothetical protein
MFTWERKGTYTDFGKEMSWKATIWKTVKEKKITG